jgi:2-keto-3-deoxy-6-phosphogluconate aldolase
LLACSGVRPENLKAYFDCGASAAAIGSGVFRQELVASGEFSRITSSVREYLRIYSAISSGKTPS